MNYKFGKEIEKLMYKHLKLPKNFTIQYAGIICRVDDEPAITVSGQLIGND